MDKRSSQSNRLLGEKLSLEMAQNGYLLLSLVFLNNHLTLPLYAEYCLLSGGANPEEARKNHKDFITCHTKEFRYLRLVYNKPI